MPAARSDTSASRAPSAAGSASNAEARRRRSRTPTPAAAAPRTSSSATPSACSVTFSKSVQVPIAVRSQVASTCRARQRAARSAAALLHDGGARLGQRPEVEQRAEEVDEDGLDRRRPDRRLGHVDGGPPAAPRRPRRASSTEPSSSIVVMSPGSRSSDDGLEHAPHDLAAARLRQHAHEVQLADDRHRRPARGGRVASSSPAQLVGRRRGPCLSTTNAAITSPRSSSGPPDDARLGDRRVAQERASRPRSCRCGGRRS